VVVNYYILIIPTILQLIKKLEDPVKNIRKMGNKYVSPGVYIRDVDSSIYTPPKNYRRIKKILRIFLKK
jgi:hypothetical protein